LVRPLVTTDRSALQIAFSTSPEMVEQSLLEECALTDALFILAQTLFSLGSHKGEDIGPVTLG
jgi:hypothetical protein